MSLYVLYMVCWTIYHHQKVITFILYKHTQHIRRACINRRTIHFLMTLQIFICVYVNGLLLNQIYDMWWNYAFITQFLLDAFANSQIQHTHTLYLNICTINKRTISIQHAQTVFIYKSQRLEPTIIYWAGYLMA